MILDAVPAKTTVDLLENRARNQEESFSSSVAYLSAFSTFVPSAKGRSRILRSSSSCTSSKESFTVTSSSSRMPWSHASFSAGFSASCIRSGKVLSRDPTFISAPSHSPRSGSQQRSTLPAAQPRLRPTRSHVLRTYSYILPRDANNSIPSKPCVHGLSDRVYPRALDTRIMSRRDSHCMLLAWPRSLVSAARAASRVKGRSLSELARYAYSTSCEFFANR